MSIAMSPALQRLIASVFLYIVMGLMAGWVAIVQNLPAEFGGFHTGLTSTQDFFYGMGTALSPPFYALVIQLGLLLLALRKDGWGTAGVLGLTIMGLMTCFGALGEPINRQIFNPATFDPLKAFLMAGMILIPIGIVAFGLMEWQSRRKESARSSANPLENVLQVKNLLVEEGSMKASTRNGALAAILAGLAYFIESIMGLVKPQPDVFSSTSDYVLEIVFIVALIATLISLSGLHSFARGYYARAGAVGFWLTMIGTALLALSALATLSAGQNSLGTAFLGGVLLSSIGYIVLGITTLHSKVLPSWIGLVLSLGFPVSVILSSWGAASCLDWRGWLWDIFFSARNPTVGKKPIRGNLYN